MFSYPNVNYFIRMRLVIAGKKVMLFTQDALDRFLKSRRIGCLINGDGYELREWLGLAEDGQYEYGDAEVPMVDESARPACSPLRVADAEVPMVDESAPSVFSSACWRCCSKPIGKERDP